MSDFVPRWRLDLDDDGTIAFDRAGKKITKINTAESCYLGKYTSFGVEEPRYLRVTTSHAPPIGKWYVTGDE